MKKIGDALREVADVEKAEILQRFFKTGVGEYGEGDVFLGLRVPQVRAVVKGVVKRLSLSDVQELLGSKYHEERLAGVLILVEKFRTCATKENGTRMNADERGCLNREKIFDFYLDSAQRGRINNWDLVDLSAPKIVGAYLKDKDRRVLYELANSENLWERRIAVISTFAFIRDDDFEDTLKIAEMLLDDEHDLIHKAVGWMLREVGKRDQRVLEGFLKRFYKKMPRVMLRYSIERFEEGRRRAYIEGRP